jgi:hypothetical protein
MGFLSCSDDPTFIVKLSTDLFLGDTVKPV